MPGPYQTASLSRAEFDAINRLFSTVEKQDGPITHVKLGSFGTSHGVEFGTLTWYSRIEFRTAHDSHVFFLDAEGNDEGNLDGPREQA